MGLCLYMMVRSQSQDIFHQKHKTKKFDRVCLNVCTIQQVHQHKEIKRHSLPSLCLHLLIWDKQTRDCNKMDEEPSIYK